jgi:hypothetical protein
MRRALLALAAAAAVIALIALLARLMPPPPGTVVLKDDGFHPRIVNVRAGETVTFRNESGKYFWPASDLHPTHGWYPSFDAKEPLAPGASYRYAFTEPGTYPFHDHLAAYFSGIVRVAGEDGSVPDDCEARGGTLACWQNDILGVLAERGLDAAYDRVAELYAAEPSFAGLCHSLGHSIGLASYQLYLEDPKLVESPKAVACASGFYHGFMEGFIGASGDLPAAARICEDVGAAVASSSPDARYQCYHGIGHGAMETAVAATGEFGSVDDMAAEAARMCEEASEGEEERYRCVSGAYNALANLYINGAYGLAAGDGEAFALCSRQPDAYKEPCYGNMNAVAMWLGKNDFSKAVPHILSIPDAAEVSKAVEYLAGMSALQYLHDEPFAPALSACRALPGAYGLPCVRGFAHGLLEHGAPQKEYERALAFCAEPAMTAAEKDTCYEEALGTLEGWYSKEKSAEICAAAPAAARSYCAE